jgi:hypothetical protein
MKRIRTRAALTVMAGIVIGIGAAATAGAETPKRG